MLELSIVILVCLILLAILFVRIDRRDKQEKKERASKFPDLVFSSVMQTTVITVNSDPEMTVLTVCPACGAANSERGNVCSYCGTVLEVLDE